MAKGKHSVALFEVINSDKTARRRFSLRTPGWFRSQKPVERVWPTTVQDSTAPAPRIPGVDLKFDPERQRINLQFSYSSAIVAAFAVIMAVSLAYVVGRHVARSANRLPTTEQLRQGPPQPAVMDLPRAASSATPLEQEDAIRAVASTSVPQPATPAAVAEPAPQRIIGQNYVVVQIYPDEKSAIEARDLLNKNGISCTIERGLSGYAASSWYCVVGLTGFDRIRNNPEYDRYEKTIRQIGEQFAGNSRFKKFDPQPYRWR